MNFELIDASGAPVGSLSVKVEADQVVVSRSNFVNDFLWKIDKSRGYALIAAAQAGDWKFVNSMHPELLPWYCPQCNALYATPSWRVAVAFDDDDWVDSYRGTCPSGHSRMIAD